MKNKISATLSLSNLKKLIKEEAKSAKQQKLMGMALKCKRTGDCASDEVKKVADGMSEKELEDFASTKHDKLPEKVDDDKKNELKKIIRSEIEAILGEAWSSTAPGGTRWGASTGIETATPLGYDREPKPAMRHRFHDKPEVDPGRNPGINYDQSLAPWKLDLLSKALADVRSCGANEQQAGHVQSMLRFVLQNYDDDAQPNEEHGKQLVATVVRRFCDRNL